MTSAPQTGPPRGRREPEDLIKRPVENAGDPRHVRCGQYSVFFIERLTDLGAHTDAWSRLASSVPHTNVFYSPTFLAANLAHIEQRPFVVLFIYHEPMSGRGRTLIAVVPFAVASPSIRRPFIHLTGLTNRYSYDSSPLVDPAFVEAAWSVLFRVLQEPTQPWRFADVVVEPESEGLELLLAQGAATSRAISCRRGRERAWLLKPLSFEEFIQRFGSDAWRGHRRRLRQLGELGKVELRVRRQYNDVAAVLGDFLALELSGWKGSEGTAMACEERDVEFLHRVAREFNNNAGLFYVELRLYDRLIGGSLSHTSGATLSAFKMAYDDAFARYSPGTIVALETIRAFIEDPHLSDANAGVSTDSWAARFFVDERQPYWFGVPTRRPLPVAFSWGLKCYHAVRRVISKSASVPRGRSARRAGVNRRET